MFTAMRRVAIAAVVLAGSMFFASSAHATFKLEVNGIQVATGDGAGNINFGVNNPGVVNYFVSAQSLATTPSSHLIQTVTMSFTNLTSSAVNYTFTLTENNALAGLPGGVNGAFNGEGMISSSTATLKVGTVNATGTIQGTGDPSSTSTIFNSPTFVYGGNNTLAGHFSTNYSGNTPVTLITTLTVTVPGNSSFTYSGSVSYNVPEPATIAMLASGVPVLGAIGWMRRKRNAKKVSA